MKLIVITLCLFSASAQIGAEEATVELSKVTVSANRTEKTLAEITNKTSVITEEDIERYSHRNIKDLVRYEPGVMVPGSGRYGLSGFNIRGIGGDRVLTLIDGVPVADEFSFGPNLSSQRDFVDLDALKAVEIVRGPASSLYGSNAIGGLVTYVTKDPGDYFRDNRQQYTAIKGGYDSVDESFDSHVTYAAGNDRHQGMILATYRNGHESQTYFENDASLGPDRLAANPIDQQTLNVLGKWVFTPNEFHQFKFTAETYKADVQTNALSQAGTVVYGTTKESVTADDARDRNRLAMRYQYLNKTTLFDELNLDVYSQNSESTQNTTEYRLSASQINETRFRDSEYSQNNQGLKLNFIKDINSQNSQQWVYGIDYDTSDVSTLRTGRTFETDSGTEIPESSNFPTRDFPNSEYKTYGIYAQNEWALFNQRFYLTPGVRYDRFELTPTVDDIYLSGNTGSPTPTSYDESQWSGKLGALFNATDQWSIFGQYAEGFKAPPMDAVNTGFTNFAGGYTAIPNPNLKPESSATIEAGVRFKGEQHQFEISAYHNRYDNFIETLAVKGFNPQTGLLEFQARNLDEATIKGIELRGRIDLSKTLDGLFLHYAAAVSEGEDESTDLPINTIQPDNAVVGVGYNAPSKRWGSEVIVTANKRKTDIDAEAIQPTDPEQLAVNPFQTPGFVVVDWVGHYRFNRNWKINWGVYNLTDKKFWRWNDVLLRTQGEAGLGRLTQPGINASATVKFTF